MELELEPCQTGPSRRASALWASGVRRPRVVWLRSALRRVESVAAAYTVTASHTHTSAARRGGRQGLARAMQLRLAG
uniref:Uncharacterized protein n=1 Tax=Oryza sativa subsp. japonica TaxID=39947 RepID=Q6K1X3_ORYSJ|nr:hypothetical protein [Oryza sativa Japonica Group]BAD20158.1 hypothetical protein [Oryza sativa Japonica Group]